MASSARIFNLLDRPARIQDPPRPRKIPVLPAEVVFEDVRFSYDPGVEVLPDGTFVTTTYGHWTAGEAPYIVSVRFKLAELDALVPVRDEKRD